MSKLSQKSTAPPTRIADSISPALDEAFAVLTDQEIRVDQGEGSKLTKRYAEETTRLVEKIGEQMDALDQQRQRLAKLLADLNIAAD